MSDEQILKLETQAETDLPSYIYKWDARATIRTRPLKLIDFSLEGDFFPPDKQPLLLNNKVQQLGKSVRKKILCHTLFKYLYDITYLEIHLINKACHSIIYSNVPVQYCAEDKLAAYTILIDEYYHVYLARLLMEQLKNIDKTLTQTQNYPVSDAFYAVAHIKKSLPENMHEIFDIIAVCIFETTLVRELVTFFNTNEVHPSIKHYVNDHMNDESRHYHYFYQLLITTWMQLDEQHKTAIGFKIAEFVYLYLNIESDRAYNHALLHSIINDSEQSQTIIDEVYHGFEVSPEIPIVKNVLSVLNKVGMMDHLAVKSGFKALGWRVT